MNHSFNTDIAMICGVQGAVIFEYLWFWTQKNEKENRNSHEGRYWVFVTYSALRDKFPYMSTKQIRNAVNKLIEADLILTGRFNAKGYDRTTWYTVSDRARAICSNGHIDVPETANRCVENGKCMCPNGQMDVPETANAFAQMGTPIPVIDTIKDTVTETINFGSSSTITRARDNPFSDDYQPSDPDPVVGYASRCLVGLTPNNINELVSFRDELPDDLIIHAIDEGVGNGARAYKYIKAILNRYVREGIRTVAEAEAAEEKRKGAKKDGVNTGPPEQDEDLWAGFTPEQIAEYERLANDGEHYG